MIADGWHDVQIPAGQGGCPALGQGTLTLYDRGFSGGNEEAADADDFGVSLCRYA